MRRLAIAIAWAAHLCMLAAAQQPSPIVVFKKARTGSTWLADMLASDARVVFFRHEAQGCFSDDAERTRKAFEVMVRRPTCSTQMCPNSKNDAWLHAPTTTECFDNKLVGFDVNPSHTPFLSWERDWPQLLRTPVKTVVYIRTNLIKHAISSIHADVLVKACDTHKVLSQKAKDCVESNTEVLSQKMSVDALSLSKSARKLGRYWVDLLSNATQASGGKVFVLYYEALQRDALTELGRLFDYVGVTAPSTTPESSSVKITPDDLRETIADFDQVRQDLLREDPALVEQLEDTQFKVFRTLRLPDNRTADISKYEVQRPKTNFIVVTTQRSGSGWLLNELQKPACIECGRELFDRSGFLWSADTMKAAVDGFLRMTPGGSNAFDVEVGDKFHFVAKKWKAQRSDRPRSYGFKWMLNQPSYDLFYEAFEEWLLPLVRDRKGKLVFLVRQHLLRLMVSKEANQIDGERFDEHVAHAHSQNDAQQHAAPVELPVGHKLLRHLDLELSKIAHMEKLAAMASDAGVRVRTVSYEDLDADHTQFGGLRSWLVDGDACASQYVDRPDTIFKIHGDAHWQKYISNWNDVSKSLQGTRYAVYLDEAYVPRGGDAWEKLRDAPVSKPVKKVHDTYQPHTRSERPGRLYPRDVPGCVTAGKDHHCRMKTYGNRTVPLFTSTPTSSPVVAPIVAPHRKKSWLGSWLRWPFY